jgi:thioredoxin-related protein
MKFSKGLAALVAVVLLLGVAACSKRDEQGSAQPAGAINWMGYTDGMKKAKETNKPVMVDFYTTWCKYCKMLDETTYKDPAIVEILNRDFVVIKIDAESEKKVMEDGKEMTERELAAQYKVTGFPTIWFIESNGKQIAPLPGYSPPEDFKPVLTFITSGSYAKGMQFADYLKTLKK